MLGLSVEQRRFDMSNVIKKAAQNAVIHEVSGIRRAFCSIEKVVLNLHHIRNVSKISPFLYLF